MANASEVIGIEIVAKTDKLRADLAKLAPGMEKEAKAMVAALERELKRAEKAAKKAADEARGAGNATKAFGDAAGKAGSSAAKLAGALDLVAPGAGSAARAVADLADVGEVAAVGAESFGVSLGAATLAAAGLAALLAGAGLVAWQVYNEESDRAAIIAADVNAAHAALEPIIRSTASATIDLQVATGQLSEAEGELLRIRGDAHAAFLQATADTKKRVAELHVEQASLTTQMVDLGARFVEAIDYIGLATTVYDGLTTSSEEVQEQIDAEMGTLHAASEAVKENVAVTTASSAAKRRQAAATDTAAAAERAYADAAKAAQEAMADDSARMADATAALERLATASADLVSGEDAVIAARDAELKQLEAIYQAGVKAADGDAMRTDLAVQYSAARLTAERKSEIELQALRQEAAAKTSREREEARATEQETALAIFDAYDASLSLTSDIFEREYDRRADKAAQLQAYLEANEENLTAEQRAQLEARIANQKEQARAAFEISQGVQVAGALTNTALAIVNALATVPYPAAPFVAAAAGVAGAAQVATILATEPSFHTGGGITGQGGMYPDERRVKALTGEAIVDRATVNQNGGAEGVRAALQSGGGGTTLRIGRLEAREIVRTDLRSGGLIPQEVRKVVSRNGRRVGISGRGVIA